MTMTDDRVRQIFAQMFAAHYQYQRQLNELRQLQAQGVALDDVMLQEVARISDRRTYAREVARITKCHARTGRVLGGVLPDEVKQAVAIATRKGCSYAEARAEVRRGK
jgi:hypothetical protein